MVWRHRWSRHSPTFWVGAMTPTQTIIDALRTIEEWQDAPSPCIGEAADRLEELESLVKWREQLVMDATRYFDVQDDSAVAYFKALGRLGLTYNYSECVNPEHHKTHEILDLTLDAGEKDAVRYRYLRDNHGHTMNIIEFSHWAFTEYTIQPVSACGAYLSMDTIIDDCIARVKRGAEEPT